jgi:hypothetical protein
MKIYFILTFFILLSAFFIISTNEIQMNSLDNTKEFFILYGEWVQQVGDNFKDVTGDVVNQDWTP